jgi:hypothetical protein
MNPLPETSLSIDHRHAGTTQARANDGRSDGSFLKQGLDKEIINQGLFP